MKNITKLTKLALLLACLPVVLFAEDKKKKEKGGQKSETKAEATKPIISTKIVTTVIGPDGEIHTTTEGGDLPDFNKIIQEATGAALGEIGELPLDELLKAGNGSITVIGPDGKMTTKKLSGNGGLNQIIQEALKGIGTSGVKAQVVDVDKPFIQQKGGVRKEIAQIRKELAAQRKLLEQILEKLE